MRKLVLILIAFIAVVTFIRAFDNSAGMSSETFSADQSSDISAGNISDLETGH